MVGWWIGLIEGHIVGNEYLLFCCCWDSLYGFVSFCTFGVFVVLSWACIALWRVLLRGYYIIPEITRNIPCLIVLVGCSIRLQSNVDFITCVAPAGHIDPRKDRTVHYTLKGKSTVQYNQSNGKEGGTV